MRVNLPAVCCTVQPGLRLELLGAVRFYGTDGWIAHQQLPSRCTCGQVRRTSLRAFYVASNRARQLYKMLFLFPVKDGKLSTGVNATFNASCYS